MAREQAWGTLKLAMAAAAMADESDATNREITFTTLPSTRTLKLQRSVPMEDALKFSKTSTVQYPTKVSPYEILGTQKFIPLITKIVTKNY